MCSNEEKTFKIRVPLPKQSGDSVYQTNETHLGVPWMAQINLEEGETHVNLFCEEDTVPQKPNDWCVWAEVEGNLFMGALEVPVAPKKTIEFASFNQSISLFMVEDLEDQLREHLEEEDAVVELRVKVKSVFGVKTLGLENFEKIEPGWTDLMIKVGEREFHVNRATLARFSLLFREMVYDSHNKPTASEIIIPDTDADVFELFLQLCHSKKPHIKVDDVPKLLELAERYGVSTIRKRCEQHLMACGKIEFVQGVQMAEKFNFDELLAKMLRTKWRVSDFEKLDGIFDSLSAKTQSILIGKMLEADENRQRNEVKISSKDREKKYYLEVEAEEKVSSLVRRVAIIEGNLAYKQRLQLFGNDMHGSRLVSEFNISSWNEIESKVID